MGGQGEGEGRSGSLSKITRANTGSAKVRGSSLSRYRAALIGHHGTLRGGRGSLNRKGFEAIFFSMFNGTQ